jgi:uncharacterized protein involved in outer membrane biogenesis
MYKTTVTGTDGHALRRKELGSNFMGAGLSILATLIGLVLLAWAILFVTKGRFLKPHFERYMSEQTQRRVSVAGDFQLYLNPIDIKFLAEGLTISNPAWATRKNFFQSKRIDTNISTLPLLFRGSRRVNWLDLADGDLNLEWDESGRRNTWTMGDPNKAAEPFEMPLIRRASIVGSDLRYRAPQMLFEADLKFETVKAQDTSFESDIRFSGNGSMRDKPFTVSGSLLSPNQTVRGGRNKLALQARGAGNVLDVSGTLRGATDVEGALLKMKASGPNLASLLDYLGAAMPETRRYRLTSNVTRTGDTWRLTGLRGTFGSSDIAGAISFAMPGKRLRIEGDLRSKVLDILDAGPGSATIPNGSSGWARAARSKREAGGRACCPMPSSTLRGCGASTRASDMAPGGSGWTRRRSPIWR